MSKKIAIVAIVTVAIIFSVGAMSASNSTKNVISTANSAQTTDASDTQATAPTQPPAAINLTTPNDEGNFYDIITNAVTQYNQAPNDMAKGAVRHKRKVDICNAFATPKISNWLGQITNLSATGKGNGVLSISLNGAFTLSTNNNEISEDMMGMKTVIPVNSTLFNKVSQMKVGDTVYFSGTFNPDDNDCFQEMSLGTDGAMQNPDFLFDFTDVREATPQ